MSRVVAWILGERVFSWLSPRPMTETEWESVYARGLHFGMIE